MADGANFKARVSLGRSAKKNRSPSELFNLDLKLTFLKIISIQSLYPGLFIFSSCGTDNFDSLMPLLFTRPGLADKRL